MLDRVSSIFCWELRSSAACATCWAAISFYRTQLVKAGLRCEFCIRTRGYLPLRVQLWRGMTAQKGKQSCIRQCTPSSPCAGPPASPQSELPKTELQQLQPLLRPV